MDAVHPCINKGITEKVIIDFQFPSTIYNFSIFKRAQCKLVIFLSHLFQFYSNYFLPTTNAKIVSLSHKHAHTDTITQAHAQEHAHAHTLTNKQISKQTNAQTNKQKHQYCRLYVLPFVAEDIFDGRTAHVRKQSTIA